MRIIKTNNSYKKNNKNFVNKVLKNYKKLNKNWKKSNYFETEIDDKKIIYIDETIQNIGAFKIRGATTSINNIIIKNPKVKSLVCASSGSFGISVANICKKNNLNCEVFLPKDTSQIKIKKIINQNALINENNKDYDDAKKNAKKSSRNDNKKFYIDGCRNDVFWGNGSLVIDLINKYSSLDKKFFSKKIAMILPIGVGSLASPSSILLKHFINNSFIITVEALSFCKFYNTFDNKIKPSFEKTIAEGVAVKKLPSLSYNILKDAVDYVSIVDENEIIQAMKYLFNNFNITTEGAGALTTALLINNYSFFKNFDYTFIPICGKNIEQNKFKSILLDNC
tara:strand:+ start:771 stop:1784 length:1014 start_codon:yes stop_codon:yes gene_type:complete